MKIKCTLRKVRLNQGGYDSRGSYWGSGAPLWWCTPDGGELQFDEYLRAPTREVAKLMIREKYKDHEITFYN